MSIRTDEKWIDELIVELRLRKVTGPDIGDAVASVRELLADSGQSAQEVFGSAREYAAALEFPSAPARDGVLLVLPVLGLIAFLTFTMVTTALFQGERARFSALQLALLAIPVLLALSLPLLLKTIIRHRSGVILLVLVCGAAGLLSGIAEPSTDAEAWITARPLPWVIGTALAMIALSTVATVLSVRRRTTDEIVDPRPDAVGVKRRGGWAPGALIANWLFPILAVLMLLLIRMMLTR